MSYPERQTEDYSADMPLERIFNSASSRILDFLILNPGFDYSASDISRIAKIPPRTLQRAIPVLMEEKLIRKTGKSGKMFMYKLNDESERAVKLKEYVFATLKENVHNMASADQVAGAKDQKAVLTH
jgi:DNA-binding transcriptional ArsR family regulator